jgi:hypothetical protein
LRSIEEQFDRFEYAQCRLRQATIEIVDQHVDAPDGTELLHDLAEPVQELLDGDDLLNGAIDAFTLQDSRGAFDLLGSVLGFAVGILFLAEQGFEARRKAQKSAAAEMKRRGTDCDLHAGSRRRGPVYV